MATTTGRRILIAAIGIAVALVVAVVAIVLTQVLGREPAAEDQLTPPNGSEGFGIYLQGKAPTEGTPHVVVWGDYNCGGCAAYEQMYGPVIAELVAAGEITAEARQAHFLDRQATRGPSKRAAMAAAAADEFGFFEAFHQSLYANQASGYTDQVLRELVPEVIGMQGADLNRFQKRYDSFAYEDWVDGAQARFQSDEVGGTPSYLVDGKRLVIYDRVNDRVLIEPTADDFLTAVKELAGS